MLMLYHDESHTVHVMDDAWMRIRNRSDPTTTRVNNTFITLTASTSGIMTKPEQNRNGRTCRTSAGTGQYGRDPLVSYRILIVTTAYRLGILQIVAGMFDEIFGSGGGGAVKYCS
jgi:hypothetical protein